MGINLTLSLVVTLLLVVMLTISCGGSAQPTTTTQKTPISSTTTQTSITHSTSTITNTISLTTVTPTITPIASTVIDPTLFEPIGIYIFPNNATIASGDSITFRIVAYNDEGNNMEVTHEAIFFTLTEAGGNWNNNTYTSENTGTWTVIGEYLNQISGADSWIIHAILIVEERQN
jgi:hypothetical protein